MNVVVRVTVSLVSFACFSLGAHAEDVKNDMHGFYVGIIGGYEASSANILGNSRESSGFPDLGEGESASVDAAGYIIGGELGHDWLQGELSYGVFGDFTMSNIEGQTFSRYGYSDDDPAVCALGRCRSNDDDLFTVSNPFAASIGARFGFDIGPLMLFAGAALSYGKLEVGVVDDNNDSNGGLNTNSVGEGSDHNWGVGYKLKAGAEMPVAEAVTIGLSYEYLILNTGAYKVAGPSYGSTNYPDINYVVDLEDYNSERLMVSVKYGF